MSFRFVSAIALAFALFLFFSAGVVYAQQDTTPPNLVAVSFEPAQVDTSAGPQTITVTVHVTDDLSGLYDIAMYFRRAETTQEKLVEFRPGSFATIVEGDIHDGKFANTIELPQYSAFGQWELYAVYTEDNVGNRSGVSKPDPAWLPAYYGINFWNGPEATDTPTPSPTPTMTPTPTLTPTPTMTPSPTPTLTASPAPTNTATPTPSQTPLPTETPSPTAQPELAVPAKPADFGLFLPAVSSLVP